MNDLNIRLTGSVSKAFRVLLAFLAALAVVLSAAVLEVRAEDDTDFDVNSFILPDEAEVLVIVEGTGGADCLVYAYEKNDGEWEQRVSTYGYLGENGMSSHRTSGDKTTPIGVFMMNTPFGQKEALEGFPENYIQVTPDYFWTDSTNKLTNDPAYRGDGEAVGTSAYSEYYDYAIDAGFNPFGIPEQGSALFLHCIGHDKDYTSGCVAIPEEDMISIMRLYGAHGDGACFIAQAPYGIFDQIYDKFGVNQGLSPLI